MRTHVVYFSATYTTRTICERIAGHLSEENIAYDVTNDESLKLDDKVEYNPNILPITIKNKVIRHCINTIHVYLK